MALTITHSTVATGADDPDAEVNKAEWNAGHTLTGDYLRKATVTLSSADILALHTTPITLVAAPGAGKWILAHTIVYVYTHVSASYSSSDSPYGQVGYAGAGEGIVNSAVISGLSASKITIQHPATDATTPADVGNAAFILSTIDATQYTDGDGTYTITVWYSVEDLP